MNQITNLLHPGDMRTKGRSEDVVRQALAKPGLFRQVVDAILHDDPGVRMRAADAAEKISRAHPEWLKPHKKFFMKTITRINQQEVRWHVAQILPRFELTAPERRTVVQILKSYLTDESTIVRTSAMQALVDIALQDPRYIPGATRIVVKMMQEGSPAMKARGKKLLPRLKKEAGG